MVSAVMEMLRFDFMVQALVVGLLVSLCAAVLGVSLVLKNFSMIGDGLSHVGFGALAAATALNAAPLMVSVPVVVLAAFLLLRIGENGKIMGDAAIALVSSGSLAVGVVLISMTTGMNVDVSAYLFGSILTVSRSDMYLSVVLASTVLSLYILSYHKIFAVTFDETFARASGVKTGAYQMLIAFLTAITVALGMRVMGALLISSLLIFPALTSMRLCKRFFTVSLCAAAVSVLCFLAGISASFFVTLPNGASPPAGASVVVVNILAFLLFWLISRLRACRKPPKANGYPQRENGANQ